MEKRELLQRVDDILQEEYKEYLTDRGPVLGNKQDPMDELIFVCLSNPITLKLEDKRKKTYYVELKQAWEAYDGLAKAFPERAISPDSKVSPDWQQVLDAEVGDVAESIKAVGKTIARDKAKQIKGILEKVRADRRAEGFDLGFLSEKDDDAVEKWLRRPDGVGPKTAHCVMLFSLGRNVLPVDGHVHRVLWRLSLVEAPPNKSKSDRASREIQEFVPKDRAKSLHVNLFKHGKKRCTEPKPECGKCVLEELCAYAGYHVLDPKSRHR